MMKNFIFCLIFVLASAGCESLNNNTAKGAGIGAAGGAVLGGIVGHQDGHDVEGALIGAAAGGVVGGVIGHQMDKEPRASTDNPRHLTVVQIAEMAKTGVPDSEIISEIDRTNSRYEMTSDLIAYLKDNKVSERVIDHMLKRRP
ncbi:MAG: glycine zipper domain-containing protein [Candidatus Omnitrophota bacterium]|nr:glycine zipper domain-containing protein [Candidatus Omnitrophota bacterium]MDZ4241353.1 glycine zipper domain-containing protein [Candidatus Omnitrophota bacterium]